MCADTVQRGLRELDFGIAMVNLRIIQVQI